MTRKTAQINHQVPSFQMMYVYHFYVSYAVADKDALFSFKVEEVNVKLADRKKVFTSS